MRRGNFRVRGPEQARDPLSLSAGPLRTDLVIGATSLSVIVRRPTPPPFPPHLFPLPPPPRHKNASRLVVQMQIRAFAPSRYVPVRSVRRGGKINETVRECAGKNGFRNISGVTTSASGASYLRADKTPLPYVPTDKRGVDGGGARVAGERRLGTQT